MNNTVSFDRLEDWSFVDSIDGETRKEVIVSFRTRQSGIVQFSYRVAATVSFTPASSREPNIHVFTNPEKEYMEQVSAIVWKIVFDGAMPAFDELQKL